MADIVLKDRVYPEVAGWADELTAIRHEIHQHPEPGLETAETAARMSAARAFSEIFCPLWKAALSIRNMALYGRTICSLSPPARSMWLR